MPNIARDAAHRRAQQVAVLSYAVDLDLTTEDTFRSETTVRLHCQQPDVKTWLDLVADRVESLTIDGESTEVDYDGEHLQLPVLPAGDHEIKVVADCNYMHSGEGLHRFTDPADGEVYLYTQHEPMDACRVFACMDQPDLKATWQLSVTAPAEWTVLSCSPTPDPEPAANGMSRWVFDPTPRISTYITALVAGRYSGVTDSVTVQGRTIPLGVYCRTSLVEHLEAEQIFDITKRGFEFFTEQFGTEYPFAKYDQVMVPEFNAGAMENAGCVTFHEDYAIFRSRVTEAARDWRANTILHELAHMWFGNLVTMQWWDDLWLNESFAEFMAYHAMAEATTEYRDSWTGFSAGRKSWGYRQDALSTTHPIAADAPDLLTAQTNFDGITYAKGASVLRQLVAWVGVDAFMAGVRAYMAKHAWGNTRLVDLLSELETTSGRDLSEWTQAWLQEAGTNTLRPVLSVDGDTIKSLTVAQSAPTGHPQLRPHRIGIGLYDNTDGQLVRRDSIELDITGASSDVAAIAGKRVPDLLLLNDGDLTFAKIRLDADSADTATKSIAAISDSLTRALIWSASWDMTRDAELPTSSFLRLVAGGVQTETHQVVLQTVLRQAAAAWSQYSAPANRDANRAVLVDAYREALHSAKPGSDHQLAFVRAFAELAVSASDLDWLAGLRRGSESLDGLTVDTDLRWDLLDRLITVGYAEPAEVESELAEDDTANGQRRAAVLRAAVPTAPAKEAAWQAAVFDTSLPNALQTATITGFTRADQTELLAAYRDRYFADVTKAYKVQTTEMATNVAQGLFPALLVEEATVAAAEGFLDGDGLPQPLRRAVEEGRDGVARAIRARARDGA